MPKHKTNDPLLQEVYDTVIDCPGVRPIDGRSTDICYVANVACCREILHTLMDKYGPPTDDDPLLNHFYWKVRDGFGIHLDKAGDLTREGVLHHIHVLHF